MHFSSLVEIMMVFQNLLNGYGKMLTYTILIGFLIYVIKVDLHFFVDAVILYYFPQYIYKPKNWLAVLFILLFSSLILSISFEKLKQLLGYKKIMDKVIRCLN